MGFECGIVGLPNVGKSTLFNALTAGTGARAEAANYPFCTINPNEGIVSVPDDRLAAISKLVHTKVLVPTSMKFVDIAGLVKGASKGEGLGNQFLGHIRDVDAVVHVVRCFEDGNIVHVEGSVDPLRDVEIIETELMLADLESVQKKYNQIEKGARSGDKRVTGIFAALSKIKPVLEKGLPARAAELADEDKPHVKDLHLLTMKRVLYVANMDEKTIHAPETNPHYIKLRDYAQKVNAQIVPICGALEAEISSLQDEKERQEFLQASGLTEPGLARLIRAGYQLLNLITYFTAGEKEVHAWTVRRGAKAPEAAGAIHSDFERGFIRAEVYHFDDLVKWGSESALREKGLLRVEGKEYLTQDGDIMHFRFNV